MTHERSRVLRARLVALTIGAVMFAAAPLAAQAGAGTAADRDAVRRAALDYIEGFYEGDTAKLVRSVRPEVYKYGFHKRPDATQYNGMQMPWPEFLAFARRVKANNRPAPATAPKQVDLFEVQDQTAAVKVTAYWGIDYLLLAKYGDAWMISHVLWQSPPPKGGEGAR